MTAKDSDPTRRDVLKGALAASVVTVLPDAAVSQDNSAASAAPQVKSNVIPRENARPGASDWQLTRVKHTGSIYRTALIEGYCSHQSIEAGQTLDIMVSTNPPQPYQIEIFRMGYYGGKGARLMTTLGPFQGTVQPDPEIGPRRLRECQWETSTQLRIPDDWPSGVYLGRMTLLPENTRTTRWQSYIIFIVRDQRPADILFQCSDNTWQAYNRWPDDYSLYTSPKGSLVGDVDVSFDRPYGKYAQIYTECPQSFGSSEFLLWEFPLCYWLEKHGYDVTYCSNSDMLTPDRAEKCKTFISVGHDEYWDLRQYESLKKAIDGGTNALFLSGNSVCFVAPFSPNAAGKPNRRITRAGRYGGLTEEEKHWGPFEVEGPNESLLIGARTVSPFNGGGDWVCTKPEHWIFNKTGMKKGDFIPGLVGWEFHGEPADIPGLEVVAEGATLNGGNKEAHWTATIYPGPKDNFVFNAATIWWAQGLSSPPGHELPWSHYVRPHGPDPRVQQITHNVLDKALGKS